jgi:AcrR family transcriptional regulator
MPSRRVVDRDVLSRDRVLEAAAGLADRDGIDALTMRRLAEELGVEAMSLYHHVPNKDAMLDGVVERCFAEIETELGGFAIAPGAPWQPELRRRMLGARRVMLRHRWLPGVLESRSAFGANMMRYTDGFVGTMSADGLSHDLIHHSLHALGSRMYGFSQELDMDSGEPAGDASLEQLLMLAPHLAAMLADVMHDDPDTTLGWCDDQTEFEFGLDLLLDGIARRAATER